MRDGIQGMLQILFGLFYKVHELVACWVLILSYFITSMALIKPSISMV